MENLDNLNFLDLIFNVNFIFAALYDNDQDSQTQFAWVCHIMHKAFPLPVHFGHEDEKSQCGKNTWGPRSS